MVFREWSLFKRFSEVFRGSFRDPLRGRFPSQTLSVLLPLLVLPLELSPICPVQKSMTEQTRSSLGGVLKFLGGPRSQVRFPPPCTFCNPPYHSREGNPLKKPPTQIKTVCTNSLCKLSFCLFLLILKGKGGDSLYKLFRNCLRKLPSGPIEASRCLAAKRAPQWPCGKNSLRLVLVPSQ